MTANVPILLKILISLFVFTSGMVAGAWAYFVQNMPESDVLRVMLETFGIAGLGVFAIGWMVKYLMRKQKEIDELRDKALENERKEKEYWRARALKLEGKQGVSNVQGKDS